MTEESQDWYLDDRHSQSIRCTGLFYNAENIRTEFYVDLLPRKCDNHLDVSVVKAWEKLFGTIDALQIRAAYNPEYVKGSSDFMLVIGLLPSEDPTKITPSGIWIERSAFDPWNLPKKAKYSGNYLARGRSTKFGLRGWLPEHTARLVVRAGYFGRYHVYYIPPGTLFAIELVACSASEIILLKQRAVSKIKERDPTIRVPPDDISTAIGYTPWVENLAAHIVHELAVRWPYDASAEQFG